MKTFRILALALVIVTAGVSSILAAVRTKPATPERIAHGAKVAIQDYLVPGKTTVFDFTSEYCPPCRVVSPRLDQLHATRDDVVVVKVDINRPDIKGIDWKSPVAQQYGLRSVPNFKVFGPDGKLVAEGKPASDLVYSWLK